MDKKLLIILLLLSLGLNGFLIAKEFTPSNKIKREMAQMIKKDIEEAKSNIAQNSREELEEISKNLLINLSGNWSPEVFKSYLEPELLESAKPNYIESICATYGKLGKYKGYENIITKREYNFARVMAHFENGRGSVDLRWKKNKNEWKLEHIQIHSELFEKMLIETATQ